MRERNQILREWKIHILYLKNYNMHKVGIILSWELGKQLLGRTDGVKCTGGPVGNLLDFINRLGSSDRNFSKEIAWNKHVETEVRWFLPYRNSWFLQENSSFIPELIVSFLWVWGRHTCHSGKISSCVCWTLPSVLANLKNFVSWNQINIWFGVSLIKVLELLNRQVGLWPRANTIWYLYMVCWWSFLQVRS